MSAAEKTPLLGDSAILPVENGAVEDSPISVSGNTVTRKQLLGGLTVILQAGALFTSYGIIAPFYPTEAAKKGASQTEVGLIVGVYPLVIFIASPFYGNYIDRLGARLMFLGGSFLLGGCSIAFGFLDVCPSGLPFVVLCFVLRLISGNGAAMNATAGYTIMAKLYPHNVGKALGAVETAAGIGLALGPSIGAAFYAVGGFRLPFIVIGAIVWFVTLLSYFTLPLIEDITRLEGNIIRLLKIPGCVIVYLTIFITWFGIAFLEPTFSPFLQKEFKFLTPTQIGLIFMVVPGVYGIASAIAGWISDKGWIAACSLFGLVICGISLLLLGPSPLFNNSMPMTLFGVCSSLTLLGLGGGFALVPVFPHILNLARNAGFPDSLQTMGLMSGLFNSAVYLAGFLGPSTAGYLTHVYGFPLAISICGFLALAMVASFLDAPEIQKAASEASSFGGVMAVIFSVYVLVMYLQGKWPVPIPKDEEEAEE